MAATTTGLALIILLLVIAIGGLLAWGIYNYQQLESRSTLVSQNPYCIRTACSTGEQPVPIELSPSQDLQRTAYGTINWCSVNAPTIAFANALADAAVADPSSPEFIATYDTDQFKTLLENFGYFYVGAESDPGTPNLPARASYTGTCGYTWKADPTQFSPTAPPGAVDDILNPAGLGGINDQVWINTVIVMEKLGFATGTDSQQAIYNRMKSLCGGPCAAF